MAVLVAITGGTCSGKSTLTRALAEQLADLKPLVLGQDTYFRDYSDLPEEEREAARTANRPDAVNWDALIPQLEALKRGDPIAHPVPGTRAGSRGDLLQTLGPSSVVLVEV